ncbi:hypothetical protein SDC9_193216 [bioreactor metagenome]|uniref:Uncharacterized protein n=1 Tax=bioreactor metagenome TaxID=1076179 RepID=A0A645I2X2_9ZZZZ
MLILLAEKEFAIGAHDSAFTHRLVLPLRFASLQILAGPAFVIRMAIHKIAYEDHAAMMIGYDLVVINLFNAEFAIGGRDFKKVAACSVSRAYVNEVVLNDRSWDHGCLALARGFPQELALRADTYHAFLGQLDVLLYSTDLRNDQRRIMGRIGKITRLPE